MIRYLRYSFLYFLFLQLFACSSSEQNADVKPKTQLHGQRYQYVDVNVGGMPYQEKIYVPIYSEIYHSSGDRRFLLTATLSIRNISMVDTLYVSTVDYYDSEGTKYRTYLDRSIRLAPLASVEFVIEDEEDKGGVGANFIVDWGAKSDLKPVIQAVMIGTSSQQGISFTTDGVLMEKKELSPQQ
ncbi:hypothetical protein OKW21_003440 [Catalinimonas alkaloidigena]|uniref:DUF3124 domain-containing protein n=1 Tax=Catalinimonas alkaloidigena TaxID=1075417 RepID=UPI002406FD5A|nr:DUF3124 domain-containing protein [Catalinimonas alkaloidigena]MDF9798177.1 hypothetical protein [Catalinimonas alkaloidigena]